MTTARTRSLRRVDTIHAERMGAVMGARMQAYRDQEPERFEALRARLVAAREGRAENDGPLLDGFSADDIAWLAPAPSWVPWLRRMAGLPDDEPEGKGTDGK